MDLKSRLTKPKYEKVKARKMHKVTVRDIYENCVRIKAEMDKTPVNSPRWAELQDDMKRELDNVDKCRKANQLLSLKDGLTIGGAVVVLVFFIALSREYPSALKVVSTILRIIPFKG